jgi:hypothetical protein
MGNFRPTIPEFSSFMIRFIILSFILSLWEESAAQDTFKGTDDSSVERLSANVGNKISSAYRWVPFNQGTVQSYRAKKQKTVERYSELALTSSAWIPRGPIRLLGPHPSMGLMLGGWRNRFLYEINVDLRWGSSLQPYSVFYQGTAVKTTNYEGGYAGINIGYGVVNLKSSTYYLLAGLGGESITSIDSDNQGNGGLSISSFCPDVGVGLQHYGKKGGLVGFELQYNFLDFQNPQGTPLAGNAFTFKLILGGISGF